MRRYELAAPAKINLALNVLARRADGFHEIASLFAPVSLADRLRVEVGGRRLALRVPGFPDLEGEDNLALRAARAFEERTGRPAALRVTIDKRIPLAAGLGGGSTDAAAVLRVLCRHHRIRVDDPDVLAAALQVGSDVPFFLAPRPRLVRGRGEILLPAPALPALWLVIVKPPFGVSAREAYAELSRGRLAGAYPRGRRLALPDRLSFRGLETMLHNDLQEPVSALHPVIEVVTRLREAGARFPLMTGSGSCVFGLFPTLDAARKCARRLELRPGEGLFLARTLKQGAGVRETDPHAVRRVDDGTGGSSRG